MLRFLLRTVPITIVLSACGGAGDAPAPAADRSGPVADAGPAQARTGRYRLEMPKVRRYFQARTNATLAADLRPELWAALDDVSDVFIPLPDRVAAIESAPALRDAVRRTGMSVQEYVTIGALVENGTEARQVVADGGDALGIRTALRLAPEHMAFVSDNRAELDRLQDAFATATAGVGPDAREEYRGPVVNAEDVVVQGG